MKQRHGTKALYLNMAKKLSYELSEINKIDYIVCVFIKF